MISRTVSFIGIPLAAAITAAEPVLKTLPSWVEHYEVIQWAFTILCAVVAFAFTTYVKHQMDFMDKTHEEFAKVYNRLEDISGVVHELKGGCVNHKSR